MTESNETNNTTQPTKNRHFKTIGDVLAISKRAYDNTTTNPEISEPMARFGMDQKKLSILGNLCSEAFDAHASQVVEYSEKAESYAEFEKRYKATHNDFSTLRKVARVAFKKDPEKLNRIVVSETKKLSINNSLLQIKTCYQNILNDKELLNILSQVGITIDIINEYMSNYQAAFDSYRIFIVEDSEAVNSTRIRDEKIDALSDFMSDFTALAKIAFANQPDLLKQIS